MELGTTEARRLELAQAAAPLATFEAELEKANASLRRRRKKEDDRHKAEMRKHLEHIDKVLRPLQAKIARAREAKSEILAHLIPRELITNENQHRSAISRLSRGVKTRRAEIDAAKLMVAKARKSDKAEGRRLHDEMLEAESELSAEVAKLDESQEAWKIARAALDVAVEAALSVEAAADPASA